MDCQGREERRKTGTDKTLNRREQRKQSSESERRFNRERRKTRERELGKTICFYGQDRYLPEIRLWYSQFCGMIVFIVARRQNAGDCRAGMSEDETNHGHQNN